MCQKKPPQKSKFQQSIHCVERSISLIRCAVWVVSILWTYLDVAVLWCGFVLDARIQAR